MTADFDLLSVVVRRDLAPCILVNFSEIEPNGQDTWIQYHFHRRSYQVGTVKPTLSATLTGPNVAYIMEFCRQMPWYTPGMTIILLSSVIVRVHSTLFIVSLQEDFERSRPRSAAPTESITLHPIANASQQIALVIYPAHYKNNFK